STRCETFLKDPISGGVTFEFPFLVETRSSASAFFSIMNISDERCHFRRDRERQHSGLTVRGLKGQTPLLRFDCRRDAVRWRNAADTLHIFFASLSEIKLSLGSELHPANQFKP